MVDQAGAIAMWVPNDIMFSSTDATWVVLHKTAGFNTAEECARYFQDPARSGGVSSHYIVGLDGKIIQCVPENRGAGANCCTKGAYASYLPYCDGQNDNMNWHSISVEHIDPKTDNSTPMPAAQKNASFRLVHDICRRHNIPMRAGDRSGGIIGHRDIDPINRSRCPGNYPWDELFSYLKNGGNMPITRDDAWVKAHFDIESPTQIRPKNGGPALSGDFLEYWLDTGGAARLPKSAVHAIKVNGKEVFVQEFESGWYANDPNHVLDRPDMPGGNGKIFMVKISDLPKLGIELGISPPPTVVEKIPATVLDDMKVIASAFDKLKKDAGL